MGCRCLLRLIWLDLINFGEPCKTDVFVITNCWVSNTKSTDCETFINWTSSNVSTLCCAVLSHIQLFATPWTVAYQTPLSMEFSRQECWSGVPFPSAGGLPHLWIIPTAPASPALAGGFFTTAPLGEHSTHQKKCHYECETGAEKVLNVVRHHDNLERESKVPYGQHPRGKQGKIPCHVGFLITGQTDQFWNVSKVKQRMAASLPETECPLVCARSMVIDVFPGQSDDGQVVAFGVSLPISLIREHVFTVSIYLNDLHTCSAAVICFHSAWRQRVFLPC